MGISFDAEIISLKRKAVGSSQTIRTGFVPSN